MTAPAIGQVPTRLTLRKAKTPLTKAAGRMPSSDLHTTVKVSSPPDSHCTREYVTNVTLDSGLDVRHGASCVDVSRANFSADHSLGFHEWNHPSYYQLR